MPVKTFEQITPTPIAPKERIKGFDEIPASREMFIGPAPEPTWWEATKKHYLFPRKEPLAFEPETGYFAGRWTKPTRVEKLHRVVSFLPRLGLKTIDEVLDRAKRIIGGVIEAPMATVGKRNITELKRFVESTEKGLKSAIRKPGAAPIGPTPGEVIAGPDWYEAITHGKKAPSWLAPLADLSVDTLLLFGYPAFKQFKAGRAAKLAKLKPAEYEAARLKPAKFKEPWKTVSGKEIKAGETIAEVISPQVENPVQKLTRLITTAERVEKAQRGLRHKEMQRRVGRYAGMLEREKGAQAFYKARGKLKGALPTAEFKPPQLEMTPAEINALVEQLRVSKKLLPLQKGNAFDGLQQLFSGQIPQRNKLILLEREFGPELVKAVLGKRALSARAFENIVDIANLPRTFLTAYDLSASLRQTYISGVRHPVKWSKAFVAQLKALKSEKNALAIQQSIRNSKYYPQAVRHKLYLPDVSSAATGLATRPEEFMSRFARYAPGVKMSERAFITMGNKMRFELWSKYCQLWKGTAKTEADYAALAKYLNAVTGRGSIGSLERGGAIANALFFSPRYLASRFQTLTAVAGPSAAVRKIAAGDLVTFVGVNLSLLTAMKFFWGDKVDVELDPRSSDFGKLRIGNTRFDAWAGYQPIARYIAQFAVGERKTTYTGEIVEQRRIETLARFGRSKLAPAPAFIVDLYTGTTFIGDEMTIAKWPKQIRERFMPLAIQDIYEATKHQGLSIGAITLPAATLGIGAVSWEPSAFQRATLLKNETAQHYFGKKWDDLGPITQRLIHKYNPEIEELERQGKAERTGYPFVQRMLKEQDAAGRKIQAALPEKLQEEMERLRVAIGGLGRVVAKDWFLNDVRYEQYQALTLEELLKRSGQIKGKSWESLNKKQQRKLLENIISQAKKTARNKIKTEAKGEDLERKKLLFQKKQKKSLFGKAG